VSHQELPNCQPAVRRSTVAFVSMDGLLSLRWFTGGQLNLPIVRRRARPTSDSVFALACKGTIGGVESNLVVHPSPVHGHCGRPETEGHSPSRRCS
jgi:hypothetical protein